MQKSKGRVENEKGLDETVEEVRRRKSHLEGSHSLLVLQQILDEGGRGVGRHVDRLRRLGRVVGMRRVGFERSREIQSTPSSDVAILHVCTRQQGSSVRTVRRRTLSTDNSPISFASISNTSSVSFDSADAPEAAITQQSSSR